MEINPETVTAEKARLWRSIGINRASLGVQTLLAGQLARLGREHNPESARRAYDILRAAGFANISVDLMFGLEHQTVQNWTKTLQQLLAWDPEHVSAYNLTVEPRTPFGTELSEGKLLLPDDEIQAQLFDRTRSVLQAAGYESYEISNFAKPGFEARHNLIYWKGDDYWGVGVSAHSFQRKGDQYRRWWNPRDERGYVTALEAGRLPTESSETLSAESHCGERLMTGLRLSRGVDIDELRWQLDVPIPASSLEALHRFTRTGHLNRTGNRFSLTPTGMLLSNEIFRDLIG
jgi:oxygen-independent coproporphyrinogen-3 oxidase